MKVYNNILGLLIQVVIFIYGNDLPGPPENLAYEEATKDLILFLNLKEIIKLN